MCRLPTNRIVSTLKNRVPILILATATSAMVSITAVLTVINNQVHYDQREYYKKSYGSVEKYSDLVDRLWQTSGKLEANKWQTSAKLVAD